MLGGAPKKQHPHTQLPAAQGSRTMCSSLSGKRSFPPSRWWLSGSNPVTVHVLQGPFEFTVN